MIYLTYLLRSFEQLFDLFGRLIETIYSLFIYRRILSDTLPKVKACNGVSSVSYTTGQKVQIGHLARGFSTGYPHKNVLRIT